MTSPQRPPACSHPPASERTPGPEEQTAGLLYRLAESLALSDEAGSTASAWDVACRADALARLEIAQRTAAYSQTKERIDECLTLMTGRIVDLGRARVLVRTAGDIVRMVDNLLLLAAEPF
jgi:hypothetical protein